MRMLSTKNHLAVALGVCVRYTHKRLGLGFDFLQLSWYSTQLVLIVENYRNAHPANGINRQLFEKTLKTRLEWRLLNPLNLQCMNRLLFFFFFCPKRGRTGFDPIDPAWFADIHSADEPDDFFKIDTMRVAALFALTMRHLICLSLACHTNATGLREALGE